MSIESVMVTSATIMGPEQRQQGANSSVDDNATTVFRCLYGSSENANTENLSIRGKNASMENISTKCRGGKCKYGK